MHSNYFLISIFLVIGLVIFQCDEDDANVPPTSTSANDFVWRAMNQWYFWQENIPNLADNRFNNISEYNNYLNGFATPDLLFESILNTPEDRFSAIFSDLNIILNSFSGVSTAFGYEFSLYRVEEGSSNIYGLVEYVVEGSPADLAGINRGDLFTSVDGSMLNENNFVNLLTQESYTLGFSDFVDGEFVENNQTASIMRIELTENPVFLTEVIEEDGVKIGYLVYNGFVSTFNNELNDAIGELASQGITELVLDLRYNGGGSVRTAQFLGSMITGDFTGQDYVSLRYNSKNENRNSTFEFVDDLNDGTSINKLGLDHIYVLTTNSSASASELVINSLRPYITVTTIGETTSGKNVGQNALFDSPNSLYLNPNTANTSHSWAMLPITFSYFNAENNNNFASGIVPDHIINEREDLGNIRALGDSQEPLLRRAIDVILGNPIPMSRGILDSNQILEKTLIGKSQKFKLLGESMYLEDPIFLNP